MNKFRNEMEIELGSERILLRPTFENIAAMEANVGSVAYLGWKFSRGIRLGADGKAQVTDGAVKALPSLTECAQIIFFNQAATKPDDPTLKKFSLEEIWDLVLQHGSTICKTIVQYLAKITAGDKPTVEKPQESIAEFEKKS